MTNAQLGGAATAIGLIVRDRRIALDLTKAEAARRAGVSRRTWHEIEEGQRATSSAETLAQVDQVLGLPDGTLFAMTSRSSHERIEALRQQAVDIIRLMSSDELQVFVDTHGADTVATLLTRLQAQVDGIRRDIAGRPKSQSASRSRASASPRASA